MIVGSSSIGGVTLMQNSHLLNTDLGPLIYTNGWVKWNTQSLGPKGAYFTYTQLGSFTMGVILDGAT